jgi:hypothetical protein
MEETDDHQECDSAQIPQDQQRHGLWRAVGGLWRLGAGGRADGGAGS